MQIDVDLEFNANDEPTFFIADNGTYKWPYDKVKSSDWKDSKQQAEDLFALEGKIVLLFDGTDSMHYASIDDAIKMVDTPTS